nr:ankyrin repeat domain-containing protein [Geobacteraceae bacterium]
MSGRTVVMSMGFVLLVSCYPVFASSDEDTRVTNRVKDMIVDLGGHNSSGDKSIAIPCRDRGTRKISVVHSGEITTYTGDYRNCRENGIIRDGVYTVELNGDYIVDSSSKRSINGELFDAVIAGDAGKVRALIRSKADVNYTESISSKDGAYLDEWSPLMSSVLAGNLEIMKLLVAHGAWVNYLNSRVVNALWLAANNGRLDMVKFLAGKGAYINNRNIEDVSPLMAAAMNGHDAVAAYLVGVKADINLRNKNGDSALMLAIENDHTSIARMLITSGAAINIRDRSGATALMIAVVEGNAEIVGLLLEHKADPTVKSASGKTALDYATLKGNAVIEALVKKALR